MIPFVDLKKQELAYREELNAAVSRVLTSGHYILGEEVHSLERELSAYTKVKHVISCASGTDALEMSLVALGLKPSDEVLIPDFSFISPAECVARLGGIPKFVDISKETFLLDSAALESQITEKTVGIIAVHLFGQGVSETILKTLAKKHSLWLLGDSAQAFGSLQNGKSVLNFGDISTTSFYPTKPLGAFGDGGAIFTNNDLLAEKIKKLRNHGMILPYEHEFLGFNSRLDELQAAILKVKLNHFDEELVRRNQNAEIYNSFFQNFSDIQIPKIESGNTSTFAQYSLQAENRNFWLTLLQKANIPTAIYYKTPLSKQPCFLSLKNKENLNAEICAECVFSIPVCAFTNAEKIIEKIKKEL